MGKMIMINKDYAGFGAKVFWINPDKLVGWYPDDVSAPNPSAWSFYVAIEELAPLTVNWASLIELMRQIDGSDGVAQLFMWANRHVQREEKLSATPWDDAVLRAIEAKWHQYPFVSLRSAVLNGQIIIDKIIALAEHIEKTWGADELEQIHRDKDRKRKLLRTMLALLEEYLKTGELPAVPAANAL